jgi:hypothetical protein
MARKRRSITSNGATPVWIDNQRRIDVDRERVFPALGLVIRPGETTNVWAVPGPQHQLQLLPKDSKLSKLRDQLTERRRKNVPWDASRKDDVLTDRQLAAFLRVSCRLRKSGKTLRLSLPSDAVDLGYFRVREPLVVFCIGSVVELWPRERWREANSVQDFNDLIRRAERLSK